MRLDGWFRASAEFGLDPWQCRKTWTQWQLEVVLAWMELQWNKPSKTDFYLMQIAMEVRRIPNHVWGKKSEAELDHMRLKFGDPQDKPPPNDKEQSAASSKLRWASVMGKPISTTEPTSDGRRNST